MSRTDPFKKKRRSANRTLLMYGEGLGEEMFLKHLRKLYSRDSGVAVTIRNGKGGNATNIILCAANEPGAYDRKIVILDNDKGEKEMNQARTEARRRKIELIENSPCLEATLLTILRPGQSFSIKTSQWCKNEFESNYLDKKKRTELDGYDRLFPKTILDRQQTKVSELHILISLMKNQ